MREAVQVIRVAVVFSSRDLTRDNLKGMSSPFSGNKIFNLHHEKCTCGHV